VYRLPCSITQYIQKREQTNLKSEESVTSTNTIKRLKVVNREHQARQQNVCGSTNCSHAPERDRHQEEHGKCSSRKRAHRTISPSAHLQRLHLGLTTNNGTSIACAHRTGAGMQACLQYHLRLQHAPNAQGQGSGGIRQV